MVRVQPALRLEKGRWRRASGERRHAGCHSAEHTRFEECVCSMCEMAMLTHHSPILLLFIQFIPLVNLSFLFPTHLTLLSVKTHQLSVKQAIHLFFFEISANGRNASLDYYHVKLLHMTTKSSYGSFKSSCANKFVLTELKMTLYLTQFY